MSSISSIFSLLSKLLKILGDLGRGFFGAGAQEYVKMEVHEARNALGVLLFSPLVGIPLLPVGVALELLPYAEDALRAAFDRSFMLDDPMGLVAGRFDIE